MSDGVEHTVRCRALGDERATRRSAACSSASCASCSCASLFAIAVAKSSANSASRRSCRAAAARFRSRRRPTTPQRRPSTATGAPTAERAPALRAAAAIGPCASRCSRRAPGGRFGRPARSRCRRPRRPAPPDGAEVAVGTLQAAVAVPFAVVAHQHAEGGVEHPCHLAPDGVEHTVRRRALGDQRGHPSQRRLFVGELRELLVRLAVCDRGREELGELGQSLLGVARQRLLALRNDGQHAPEAALHGDRRSHRRAKAHLAGGLGRLARRFCVVVDASGPAGLEDQARHGAFERVAAAEVAVAALGRPAADRSDGPVCLVARERGTVGADQCRHLRAHGFEHLCRWRARCNQRRHPPQRRLLLGEPRELVVRLAVGDRGRHQLGELREPILEHARAAARPATTPDRSPDRAVDDDRGAGSRVEAGFASSRRRARREGRCSPRLRAGRPVRCTCATIDRPSSGQRVPGWRTCGRSLHVAMTVIRPSLS